MSVLEIRNLTIDYVTTSTIIRAVSNVSFAVNSGEVVGVVGESGCGKTTLGLAIIQLLPVPPARYVSGSIIYKGLDVLKVPRKLLNYLRGTEIAMVFQEPLTSLNPVLTIREQIEEAILVRRSREALGSELLSLISNGLDPAKYLKGKNAKISHDELVWEAIRILKSVRIADPERILTRYPHELSGGMRQRIMIAISLTLKPSVLILDEPTSALDVTTQAEILQLLKSLISETRAAVIFITHDLATLRQIATKVDVMYAGRIVEEADARQLYSFPFHPYTKGLIASYPSGYKRSEALSTIPGHVPDLGNLPAGCKFHPRCGFVFQPCVQEEPKLIELTNGRKVACYLYPNRENEQ